MFDCVSLVSFIDFRMAQIVSQASALLRSMLRSCTLEAESCHSSSKDSPGADLDSPLSGSMLKAVMVILSGNSQQPTRKGCTSEKVMRGAAPCPPATPAALRPKGCRDLPGNAVEMLYPIALQEKFLAQRL